MKCKPPKIAEWIVLLLVRRGNRQNLMGDLLEEFQIICRERGIPAAKLWYMGQVIIPALNLLRSQLFWSGAMFKNYLLTSFRNIKKHKSFTIINIAGLSIGLACSMLLAIYINSELSFDSYHIKKERIFRLGEDMAFNNFSGRQSATNGVIAKALMKYPEVEATARFRYMRTSAKYKEKQFSERFYYCDPSVFTIFTWPMLKGEAHTALEIPYSIVLTSSAAAKYFGHEDPLGKALILNENEHYTVTGVMADIPEYSTLNFQGLCSFSTLYKDNKMPMNILNDWTSHNFNTYLLIKEGSDPFDFQEKIEGIYYDYVAEKLAADGSSYSVFLQPLKDIYLRPLRGDFGPITYVYTFGIIAVFVLFIACVNFMNLSASRSMTRAREVGVRKVFGASRSKLVKQFLVESLLITTLAMLIALGIAISILPLISIYAQRDLMQDVLGIPWLIPAIISTTLAIGLIGGSYPALILSGFKPLRVIQNKLSAPKANSRFRRGLVLLQFTISITLIIGTALVVQQLDFLKTKDVGFDKEHVVCVSVRDQLLRKSWPVLQQRLLSLPEVINSGASSRLPGWSAPLNSKLPEGYNKENTQLMREINIDEHFLSTAGIQLIKGRNFSKAYGNDPRGSVIINETAAKKFGWDFPLGKTIQTINTDIVGDFVYEKREVIGVVKDFHLSGLTSEIQPAFIANVLAYPFEYGKIHVLATRIKPDNIASAILKMEAIWKELFPDKPFNYYFLDEDFNEQFYRIERSRDILSYFTFLAIFIACLGLFGMVAYAAEKRTKEIAIRKTLGSSVTQIVSLLSNELILLVLAANIIAYPIAWFSLEQWLNDFPYRMDINFSTFLFSTLLALVISSASIAYQVLKAATANPARSLRYE